MRRLATIALAVLAVLAVAPAGASAGLIDLKIQFRADTGAKARLFTLRCAGEVSGTVPHPADACRRLRKLGDDAFRPTPAATACTEISGGPSTARVTGIYHGRPLWARLRLDNGCEIARWQRVGFLLPQPTAPR